MAFNKKKIKKAAFKPVKKAIDKIDFVKLCGKIASAEPGRSFMERPGQSAPAFPDQEKIIQHVIEATERIYAEKGEHVPSKDIEDYARSISCKYDEDVHRIVKGAVFNVMTHMFDHADIDNIFLSPDKRELPYIDDLHRARKDDMSVLYLVNHSSHFDEFIVDVVLEQMGIQLPLFAAGANMLATPSVEKVIMLGSYLIIRKGASKTYLSTLFQYCKAIGELGKQQGIFLEAWSGGARTRDGSLRYPRRLVTLQGALASEKNILVQPIVISYSAVPEDKGLSERAGGLTWIDGHSMFSGLLKSPHKPVKGMLGGLKGLFGRAFISFCRPRTLFELQDMCADDPNDLALDEYVALYSMKEIAKNKKVLASQLTARGFIRARKEDGLDIVSAAEAELEDIIDYHRRTFGQDPDLEDFIKNNSMAQVVENGLEMLQRRKILGKVPFRGVRRKVLAENGLQYYATHADRRLYSPSARENIVIVGAGPMGYGLSRLIGHRTLEEKKYHNSSLTLFDSREDLITEIVEQRSHPVHFEDLRLPKNVFPASDATAAFLKATDVIITSPIEFFETDLRRVLAESRQALNVVITTKGFDPTNHRLPIQIAQDVVKDTGRGDVTLHVLAGPVTPMKLAEETNGVLVIAGPEKKARTLGNLFRWNDFSVFVCEDPIGVQVASALAEVYSFFGAYLIRTKELQGRVQVAGFIRETSEEAIEFAETLGGRKETFLPNNPAWTAEYIAAGMGGPGAAFGRQAGRSLTKARQTAMEFVDDATRDKREEGYHLIGYYGIRSAYLASKNMNLDLPRLRQAYRIFWKD